MRRAAAVVVSLILILAVGCRDYDYRLQETYEDMKYRKRLNDNLSDAPAKGLLQQELIFVRPPVGLTGPTQTFNLTAVEPGKFDVENSFIDQAKSVSLHILARHKKPKGPPSKKTPAPAEPVARGDFTSDVLDVVKNAYATDLPAATLKNETKVHKGRENKFKFAKLDLATKEVQLYVYGAKNDAYEVALIFEYPKTEVNNISPKIGLCLECFAIGEAARRAFSGSSDFEGVSEEGQAPPI
jgi:hypothetical protein